MDTEIESILLDTGGKRRVVIYRRRDGHFSLREEYWFENVYEGKLIAQGWAPYPMHANIYETAEAAARDAPFRFPHLQLSSAEP